MHKLTAVTVTSLAGYGEISWPSLQPTENLLVGRNGSGKSSLLEAIVIAMNFLQGKRSGDLLAGAAPEAQISLAFADGTEQTLGLGAIRASQTPKGSRPVENVLYIHESRRAKSRFGKGRSRHTQHPSNRYEYVLSELQALRRGNDEDQALAEHLVREASSLRHAGHPAEWGWLEATLPTAGPGARRPVSCGQYDVLSLLLDVMRLEQALRKEQLQPFIVIDNPEAFLHPALQQEVLDWVRSRVPEAQLFLASHSLKLLSRAAPASIFWLSRDHADGSNRVKVQAVRDLAPEDRGAFFELYGDDTSSVVFNLAIGLESSEYLAFLCACALPCRTVARPEPIEQDVQIRAVMDELRHFTDAWTLVDVGAGAGDLLLGAERLGIANPRWEYVAVQAEPTPLLIARLATARELGRIAPTSRILASMEEVPANCDAAVFGNTCHALGLDRLSDWLAIALERLRPGPGSRCVIHEVEILRHGERNFIMWTPDDYRAAFGSISGVDVATREYPRVTGVPIHTTVLRRIETHGLPEDLAARLRTGFEALLVPKLKSLRRRLELLKVDPAPRQLREALRQREYAFVSQQCNAIFGLLLDRRLIDWPSRADGSPS